MGTVIAAVVLFTVLGVSMGLLFSHLEQVDEYNKRVSEISHMQQTAVQERIAVSATLEESGAYDIHIENSGPDTSQIIEVRSMTPAGRVEQIEGGSDIDLEGFAERTLSYTVPDGVEQVSILAITARGNTFGTDIVAGALLETQENAGSSTVNGMGVNSRLAQAEFSGRTIFGSDIWGTESSLKPYTIVDSSQMPNSPNFVAVILDDDVGETLSISEYNRDTTLVIESDKSVSNTPTPNILAYTHSRGDATVSQNSEQITVSGSSTRGKEVLLKLDPKFHGKKLLFDAEVSGGKIEILSSPYVGLTRPVSASFFAGLCTGISWDNLGAYPNGRNREFTPKIIRAEHWTFDPKKLDGFFVGYDNHYEGTRSTHVVTYDKSTPSPFRLMHAEYWHGSHVNRSHTSEQNALTNDHGRHLWRYMYSNSNYPYYAHSGLYKISGDTLRLDFDRADVFLANGKKFAIFDTMAMDLSITVSAQRSNDWIGHGYHGQPTNQFSKSFYTWHINNQYYSSHHTKSVPSFTVNTNSESKFERSESWSRYYSDLNHIFGMKLVKPIPSSQDYGNYVKLDNMILVGAGAPVSGRACVFAQDPYNVHHTITSNVQNLEIDMPSIEHPTIQQLYIKITAGRTPITISATENVAISGLAAEVPYRIVDDAKTVHTGMSSESGTVEFFDHLPESFSMILYPNVAKYRGNFSTIVIDPHAKESFRLPTEEDRIYVVHTWAHIPVAGNVEVSDVKLMTQEGSEMRLEYLDGSYAASNTDEGRIWVPVIPGYYSIHMTINGIDATLRYSDVLGAKSVKIVTPATNTISKSSSDPINTIAASSGTTAYAIATFDGNMGAIIQGSVSGTAFIDHSFQSRIIRTCNRDPLTGMINVYKNGELFAPGTKFVDYTPDISTRRYTDSGGISHIRTTFTYDNHHIEDTFSVPVRVGDYVEFVISSEIEAHSTFPSRQARGCWATANVHISSHASATANIHDGSIIIG